MLAARPLRPEAGPVDGLGRWLDVSSGGSALYFAIHRAGIWIYGEPMDHVVVVGAGIGGLAASLVLSRVAKRVTLVERADHPAEVGAALALQANGMAVLNRLGLLPNVERVGARIDRMDIRNAGGRVLLTAKMPDFGGGLDHAVAVRRTQLHQLLLDAVNGEGSVRPRFGCTAMSADPSGSLVVRSGPSGGEPTATTTLHADLVVGADGVNSAVRSTGGFHSRLSAGSSYVRTIVQGQANPWFEEFWTPLGSFGHAPLGGDTTYFWAAAHSPAVTDAVSRRDLRSFAEEWRRVLPLAGDLLARVTSFDDLLLNTVRRVDCRRWFSGRLVLLGDAAHAMAPNLGQGANSALGDTVALAEALVTAPSVPAALERYDHRRRPVARRVQDTAGFLQRLCNLHQARPIRVRDAVLMALTRFPRLGEGTTRRALASDVRTVTSASVLGNGPGATGP
jgi:2-polyprenyl-6-methoxyphenol hydroxylase-like FAD-dependent oxidoreductase